MGPIWHRWGRHSKHTLDIPLSAFLPLAPRTRFPFILTISRPLSDLGTLTSLPIIQAIHVGLPSGGYLRGHRT